MAYWVSPALIILLCVIGWIVFSHLISRLSGWRKLAQFYRATQPFCGKWMRPWAATMGQGANYNGLINIAADAAGIHLSISFVFRAGHPPLFIPFAEVSATTMRSWRTLWLNMAKLEFARYPSAFLLIPSKTAEALSQASGLQFRVEKTA